MRACVGLRLICSGSARVGLVLGIVAQQQPPPNAKPEIDCKTCDCQPKHQLGGKVQKNDDNQCDNAQGNVHMSRVGSENFGL